MNSEKRLTAVPNIAENSPEELRLAVARFEELLRAAWESKHWGTFGLSVRMQSGKIKGFEEIIQRTFK